VSRRVLLVASKVGYQTHAFDEAASRMGIELMLATDRCHMLDDPWRDRAIPVKFDALEASAAQVEPRFGAVVAVGDRPAALASLIAARQRLRFHPPHAVDAARNKYLARERFKAAGLLTPQFSRVGADTGTAATTFPCVLKPLGLSGSRGVIRVNNPTEFDTAFARIRRLLDRSEIRRLQDPADRFIQVEEYIPGREFAVEGLVRDGRVQPLAMFDKPDPLEGPYFEETIYVTPSREPAAVRAELIAATQRAATALGFTDGPLHAELRYNERGAWPLEIAARPIGGLCARALPGLEERILRHALGEEVAGIEIAASGVMMIPIGAGGVYQGVEGVDDARAVPLITDIEITAKIGQLFEPLPEGASYLGFIFARGENPADVEDALRTAFARLHISFSHALPLV
jgi:hypothetical protein